eukprot:CAMPEP_0198698586 /NCGR_PEP_ID=MMETSP1468-20131203/340276_1 /TAXON_ID=1461545 /ORGANISM="Mantoniella sp, Strain CCMP1436" /LENGTH=47 /DNA_ID= /DNA_START= /DNA_END= /DNA_ORIENTATION=
MVYNHAPIQNVTLRTNNSAIAAGFSAKYVHASAPSYATIAPRTMTAP